MSGRIRPLIVFAAVFIIYALAFTISTITPDASPITEIDGTANIYRTGDIMLADGSIVRPMLYDTYMARNTDNPPVAIIAFIGDGIIGRKGTAYAISLHTQSFRPWKAERESASHTGWFIPAAEEYGMLYRNRDIISRTIAKINALQEEGLSVERDFLSGIYWTSSVDKTIANDAYAFNFSDGKLFSLPKTDYICAVSICAVE